MRTPGPSTAEPVVNEWINPHSPLSMAERMSISSTFSLTPTRRSNGLPIYHLSVVADDIYMGITHVIRGDDHISNTPKHILLWQALGRTPPEFAHVPLILGTDKKKLSKRHGITSVTEYASLCYLPDAMVNFLGLLGWSPGGNRELMSRDEMIGAFTLDGISGGADSCEPGWATSTFVTQ